MQKSAMVATHDRRTGKFTSERPEPTNSTYRFRIEASVLKALEIIEDKPEFVRTAIVEKLLSQGVELPQDVINWYTKN
jgi:hypothetical protein